MAPRQRSRGTKSRRTNRHDRRIGTPSYIGLKPASKVASAAARGASKKVGTSCELALCSALRKSRLRFKSNVLGLPGCPDIVFQSARLAIFCDGDFWHGRNLKARLKKL